MVVFLLELPAPGKREGSRSLPLCWKGLPFLALVEVVILIKCTYMISKTREHKTCGFMCLVTAARSQQLRPSACRSRCSQAAFTSATHARLCLPTLELPAPFGVCGALGAIWRSC